MSLIYHNFPTAEAAFRFAGAAAGYPMIDADVFFTEDDAMAHDPFPCTLNPPIVHVERTDAEAELRLDALAKGYGGSFAGT